MKAPIVARILGIGFLIAGILGFVPFVMRRPAPTDEYVQLSQFYGFLFTLFAVNVVLNGLHVLFGLWGLLGSRAFPSSVRYCRWTAWIFAVLFTFGIVPILNTFFGVAPVYGNDIWLHALIVLFAAYGGYGAASIAPPEELVPPAPTQAPPPAKPSPAAKPPA